MTTDTDPLPPAPPPLSEFDHRSLSRCGLRLELEARSLQGTRDGRTMQAIADLVLYEASRQRRARDARGDA